MSAKTLWHRLLTQLHATVFCSEWAQERGRSGVGGKTSISAAGKFSYDGTKIKVFLTRLLI